MMQGQSRPEECLSDFALERRLAGEGDAPEDAKARDHVESCARCTRRLAELEGERDRFAREAPRLARPTRGGARTYAIGMGVLAMAAGILFLLQSHPTGEDFGTRVKGSGPHVGLFVQHKGHVRSAGAGERVAPGDALRFTVTTAEPRYVAVLSVDGARHASVYYPSSSPDAARVEPGGGALPESTVLDDTLGAESLYAVFCPESFPVEPLRHALEASPDAPPSVQSGCAVDTLRVIKERGTSP